MSTETGGVSGFSDPVHARQDWFSAAPNPFTDEITFRFRTQMPVPEFKLQIIDMFGRIVYQNALSSGIRQFRWVAAGLPPGIYVSRVILPTAGSKTAKLIKH